MSAVNLSCQRSGTRPTTLRVPRSSSRSGFAGVHGDVGGGYASAGLSDIALAWLMRKAENVGLAVDIGRVPGGIRPASMGKLHDSMTEFYPLFGNGERQLLPIRLRPNRSDMKTHESVAATARERWD